MSVEKKVPRRVLADKGFAKRLDQTLAGHPSAPEGHGRQKWLRERIEARFNRKLSPEAVRKWLAAEARPKTDMMRMIAQALEVDEAWLALGITPGSSPEQKRQHNALTTGAINLVAGLIQLNGGHIAYPEGEKQGIDLYAIIGGAQKSLVVCQMKGAPGQTKITVPAGHEKAVVVLAVQNEPTDFEIVRLPTDVINETGTSKGGFYELEIDHNGQNFRSGGKKSFPRIKSFDNLDGELPPRR